MTINNDLFVRPPLSFEIPNDGVTNVDRPEDPNQWGVLKYEVRWKSTAEQPIGWEPDLDDGVRLNIRPFVAANVLRSRVNVHWREDRGTNPDGSGRYNDLHPTLDERRAARREAEAAG